MVRYTGEDMDKMQQEAVRRMQEMQIRGRGGRASPPVPEKKENTVPAVSSEPQETPAKEIKVPPAHNSTPKKDNGFLDMLFQDKEKSLILLLILILSSEKNDTGLLFALAYLLI